MMIRTLRCFLLLFAVLGCVLCGQEALGLENSLGTEAPAIVLVAETDLADEAEFEIQEEYEQLGHISAIRTAATTPPGTFNIDVYYRFLSEGAQDIGILKDVSLDVWSVNFELELGLAKGFDVQAGIEVFRSEDFAGAFVDESGLGRPFVEATLILLEVPGQGQRMGGGIRVDFPSLDDGLLGDEPIFEPFFVLNQEMGQFTLFVDLGLSLESGDSHLDLNLGGRLPVAENALLFQGPLDLLLGFTVRFGNNSIFAITPAIETAPRWLPGNLSLALTLGLTDDAFDWGVVAGTDFRF